MDMFKNAVQLFKAVETDQQFALAGARVLNDHTGAKLLGQVHLQALDVRIRARSRRRGIGCSREADRWCRWCLSAFQAGSAREPDPRRATGSGSLAELAHKSATICPANRRAASIAWAGGPGRSHGTAAKRFRSAAPAKRLRPPSGSSR